MPVQDDPTRPRGSAPTHEGTDEGRTDEGSPHGFTLTTPFHDLDEYVALPRLSGLTLSPDGSRLVTTVATVNHDATKVHTALWEIYPTRSRPARRLTRSAQGESEAAFTPDGDLLFTSSRPNADTADDADPDDPPALWVLPAGGGEARMVAARPGGVRGVRTARSTPTVVFRTDVLPSAQDAEQDARLRAARKDAKVGAVLHTDYPVRYWDADLGPDVPHLLGWHFEPSAEVARSVEVAGLSVNQLRVDDLAPNPGQALREAEYDLSPDGALVVSTWKQPAARGAHRSVLMAIGVSTGERRVLVDDPDADLSDPRISPDGRLLAYVRESHGSPDRAPRRTLHVMELADGEGADGSPRRLGTDWDRWPAGLTWLPDCSALVVTADQDGRGPVFVVPLDSGVPEQLTTDDATYSDLQVAPDGSLVYALRTSWLAPPHPVRITLAPDEHRPRGTVTVLRAPAPPPTLPGSLTEVTATAEDGTAVRGWLALPDDASEQTPAPLLVWVHGGPLSSWNGWSWRWNPWLMVARGYAVVLPDPALSTGYGQSFVERGWGRWGDTPFTDLMTVTDAVTSRPDVDAERTAIMGGSFGGYLASWTATRTDRFRAIVSHAGLWSLEEFATTTDVAFHWQREVTPEHARQWSPHHAVADIRTPVLVVHGDRDHRVPIGQAVRQWYELLSASALAADDEGRSPHRFLYYPDEGHWVLRPQNAKVWYETVLGFLAEHVLEEEAPRPSALG